MARWTDSYFFVTLIMLIKANILDRPGMVEHDALHGMVSQCFLQGFAFIAR